MCIKQVAVNLAMGGTADRPSGLALVTLTVQSSGPIAITPHRLGKPELNIISSEWSCITKPQLVIKPCLDHDSATFLL